MGRVRDRQEAARKRVQREDCIRKALKAVQTLHKDGKPVMSLRDASSAFQIPYSTLRDRLNGAQPHIIAHRAQQTLTPTDEKAVVRWIKHLESCGFPPKAAHVQQAICRQQTTQGSMRRHSISQLFRLLLLEGLEDHVVVHRTHIILIRQELR